MNTILGRVVLCGVALASLNAASCSPVTVRSQDLAKALEKYKWTFVDVPREVLGAGAIVSITKDQGIRFRSRIESCVSDATATHVSSHSIALGGTFNTSHSFDADVALAYGDLKAGPKFSSVKSATVTLGTAREYVIDEFLVSAWLKNNWNSLSPDCKRALQGIGDDTIPDPQQSLFVLQDVIGVDGYTLAFKTETGAELSLSDPKLKDYVDVQGNTHYKVTSDGKLASNELVYIAFKGGLSAFKAAQGAGPSESAQEIQSAHLRSKGLLQSN